jgi:hypothetical protein
MEMLQKQNERIEGFKEGYQAALNWIAANVAQEKQNTVETVNVDTTKKD